MRRNVDVSVNIVLRGRFNNTLSSLYVDIFKRKVPTRISDNDTYAAFEILLRGIVSSDQVVDDIGMADACFYGWCIAKVIFLVPCYLVRFIVDETENEARRTTKTIRPRSPVTFKCRLVISSRKGTTTVHPWRASQN